MTITIGDKTSALLGGLSSFWQRFFKDVGDIEAYYEASEVYLGQVYLDLLSSILNIGAVDTPIFNKEYWKLFAIKETDLVFEEGASVAEDRYVYDMPGDAVSADFLQNCIFDPSVILERGVQFDVNDNDGYVRFNDDPFQDSQDSNGNWLPPSGVGWRTLGIETGNKLTDRQQTANWDSANVVKKGDDLRLLGYRGALVESGTNGHVVDYFGYKSFIDPTMIEPWNVGDVIQVYGSAAPDTAFDGYYLVQSEISATQALLELTAFLPTGNSTTHLKWNRYRTIFFEDFRDYRIGYLDGKYLVGLAESSLPLDIVAPLVYAVVRDVYSPKIVGRVLNWVSVLPVGLPTFLGQRHVIPGTLTVFATVGGIAVVEGIDYTVDYFRGLVYQITAWDAGSLGKCDFEHRRQVVLSAGGEITESTLGYVKQLSYWVPEVQVDRFNLWYNYGSLLNRFEASSENYKAFLRGIMYLYMSGPILERIESGLNVAAGYPVTKSADEVLTDYDDGIIDSGTDGILVATLNYFATPSYIFTEKDVGGYIVIESALSDINEGKFRILNVIDANTVELETSYGFISENPIDWVLTYTYLKTVTTTGGVYKYPYFVPIRTDVMDPANYNILTFDIFEVLTYAFTVTDYIEDPTWWYGKTIPSILWTNANSARRRALTTLFPNIVGGADDAQIGDPGLYVGADEDGNLVSPTDAAPGAGDPVSIYRHNLAFYMFDRYFKLYMFYVEFHENLELPLQFKTDLEDLILVVKSSGTYPYVEPNETFVDNVTLEDVLTFAGFGLYWGPTGGDVGLDSVYMSDNSLVVGDADFPWTVGDYYRYVDYSDQAVTGVTGAVFTIPLTTSERLLTLNIQATVGGDDVLEGRDYSVNWGANVAPNWQVTRLTTWDSPLAPLVDYQVAVYDNASPPLPDTTLGFTPIAVSGLNPGYVRNGALDSGSPTYTTDMAAIRTESVDRALSLTIVDTSNPPSNIYIYP